MPLPLVACGQARPAVRGLLMRREENRMTSRQVDGSSTWHGRPGETRGHETGLLPKGKVPPRSVLAPGAPAPRLVEGVGLTFGLAGGGS